MSEEWCQERLRNLRIEDRRLDALDELKNQLNAAEESILCEVMNSSSLFECLGDRDTSPLACDVLSICMNNLSLEKTIKNTSLLERLLTHPNPLVKALGVNEVSRIVRHSKTGISDVNIVIALVECLKTSEMEAGSSCIDLLAQLLPPFITNNAIRANLEQTLTLNETVKCRTFEVAVKVARESPELLDQVEFVLQKMIAEIENRDILYQLNILELLSELPTKHHGLVYLENTGVFSNLLRRIETIAENPLSGLLIPGLMKFFGNVGSIHPSKIFMEYPSVVNSLFNCIRSNDYSLLPTGLDTFGFLGRSAEGKKHFDSEFGLQTREVLKEMGSSVKNFPTELKIRVFDCVCSLLYVAPGEENNQISSITESWYGAFSTDSDNINFVFAYAQNPFPDIKTAAFSLLRSLVHHRWGQQRLQKTGGFIEFLLDRKSEFQKDLVQDKYDIIKLLAESTIFDASTLVQFKKYVTEGAFYVQGVTEVATDGAS